ncbi:hypothetical protein KEM48_011798 [Puccinia striiformis f. sp. tritici PST-130]|nr:hypothetical protein KEM48_011798 [Puccinia striiformis f. sp. tritici PST-130]
MSESNRKMSSRNASLSRSPLTRAIHSEGSSLQDLTAGAFGAAVGPDITVSTTFLKTWELNAHSGLSSPNPNLPGSGVSAHSSRSPSENHLATSLQAYRRSSHPVLAQTEKTLGSILNGDAPDVIAIRDGYRGCHETIKKYCQLRGMGEKNSVEVKVIDLDDRYPLPESGLRVLVWLETPVNPTGECRDIQSYARKVRQCAGDRSSWSTRLWRRRLKSGTLAAIVERPDPPRHAPWLARELAAFAFGQNIAAPRDSSADTATRLAVWLNSLTERDYRSDTDPDETRRLVSRVWHSSFQDGGRWLFIPATSLGGVESLIQHQVQADPSADPRIVRISVGLEDFQDLKNDLIQAFDKVIRWFLSSTNATTASYDFNATSLAMPSSL